MPDLNKVKEWVPEDEVDFDATELVEMIGEALEEHVNPTFLTLYVRDLSGQLCTISKATLYRDEDGDTELLLTIERRF